MKLIKLFFILLIILSFLKAEEKRLAYVVSDIRIPFWSIMAKGMKDEASKRGYIFEVYSANNLKKIELQNIMKVLSQDVNGVIISPINSSTAVTMLQFTKQFNTPVVISDIGTDGGEYISFISSNNKEGAYNIGKVLAKKMKALAWDKQGTVGIIAIPQKRANGKARTEGFMKAMRESNIKGAGLLQQVDFSYKETYNYAMKLIKENPNLRAIWLQGSDRYKGALDAIKDSHKIGEVLLVCFDSEPEFLEMIPSGMLVGAAMQQPYLMGQKAVESMDDYLHGKKVQKEQKLEVLAISQENIKEKLSLIKQNVLGIK